MEILQYTIILLLVQPLAEYFFHRLTHIYSIKYHIEHHKKWSDILYHNYIGDYYVRSFILCLFIMKYYLIAIIVLKYELTHTISHIYPDNYLYKHHKLHHKYKKVNYSFSAVWPDKLFGTLLLEDTNNFVQKTSLSEKRKGDGII